MPSHSVSTDLTRAEAAHSRYLRRLPSQPDPLQLERFEREYHTLLQLAHPNIVRVYDFDIDDQGAYCAMESLPDAVEDLAPVPWRRACAIARDVCSALSFLHARRLVHRDVSPRNVRCSSDDEAKLTGFASLAPFGTAKQLVGTPACCAPESLHMQNLDARVDLFGLGATLYYLLSGRHAYPARSFGALPHVWRSGVPRLTDAQVPAELEALVLGLLHLEPDARPAGAIEVMKRLSAIDGAASAPQLTAASACLATPRLVGRESPVARVQRRMRRATGGRPRSMLIEGPAGVGRTRFLDACLLEATVRGQTLVRVDADDALSGDYGVVRALATQLHAQLPEQATQAAGDDRALLSTLIVELRSEASIANDVELPRGQLQRALLAWLTRLSKQTPFVLAVDDFHRIDEPSAALIALLEQDSPKHELCLLITAESGATWSAEAAHTRLSALTTQQLDPLSDAHSEQLLRSVFGDVPHVSLLAQRLRELCAGSARDLMRMAQHLVERGVVRFEQGAWTLPADMQPSHLPRSVSDALAAEIAALPHAARELACALALCPDQSFSYEDCGVLCGRTDPGERLAQINALQRADVVRHSDGNVRLSARSWMPLLRATLSPERAELIESRLAELFELRSDGELLAARHWFRAGMPNEGLDMLVLHVERSQELTHRSADSFQRYVSSLPEGWRETFEAGLRHCEVLGRTRWHRLELLSRLVANLAALNVHAAEPFSQLLLELRRASGYDDWQALDAEMDPPMRLFSALTRAEERFEATPEAERLLAPADAVRRLARYMIAATGPIAQALDVSMLRALPRLRAFAALSPALEAGDQLLEGLEARCRGRLPRALAHYTAVLAILEGPDHGRMEPAFALSLKLGVIASIGIIEAGLGRRTCEKWAAELDSHPMHTVHAAVIRMLDCSYQGDRAGAERQKQLAERLRMQNGGLQEHEADSVIWELHAHALSGDLRGVRHMREELAPLARRYPQWVPVSRYAAAEYYRMTRGFKRARAELEQVLGTVAAGTHPVWPYVAQAHVLTLLELDEHAQALSVAEKYVSVAARELEYVPSSLQLAHALCRADESAASAVDEQIAGMQREGIAGLHLGVAHETRARIALQLSDEVAFAQHSELCRQLFCAHRNAALTAKYQRLVHAGRRALASSQPQRATLFPESYEGPRVELALADCRDEEQRARLALTLLIRESGASAGLLYFTHADTPLCAAQLGAVPEPTSLVPQVQHYLESMRAHEDTTDAAPPSAPEWLMPDGRAFAPLMLGHYERDVLIVTGVAVLGFDRGQHEMPADTGAAISQFYALKSKPSLLPPAR